MESEDNIIYNNFIKCKKTIYMMLKSIQEERLNKLNINTYGDFDENDLYISSSGKLYTPSYIKIDKEPYNINYINYRYVAEIVDNTIKFNLSNDIIKIDNKILDENH